MFLVNNSWALFLASGEFAPHGELSLKYSDCFHMRAKCAILILIRSVHYELKFERRYFGLCVRQITLRCVIWNAHFKWRSGGVFQLRILQITQRNHRMNALSSKLWFWGAELSDLLTTSAYIPRACIIMYRSTGNASSVQCLIGRLPRTFCSRFWNAKSQIRSLVCTLRNSNIAITSLVCTLRNSKCAIQMIIQITHFALVWKVL